MHAGVCRLCFSAESTAKHGRTVASFREPFERDLNPLTPGFPATLGELALRLKIWRLRLQTTLDQTMPPCLHLEAESRNLQASMPTRARAHNHPVTATVMCGGTAECNCGVWGNYRFVGFPQGMAVKLCVHSLAQRHSALRGK